MAKSPIHDRDNFFKIENHYPKYFTAHIVCFTDTSVSILTKYCCVILTGHHIKLETI